MSTTSKPTRSGPNIGQQPALDTTIAGIPNTGPKRGPGDLSARGNIAISDIARKTPGGKDLHHCPLGHKSQKVCWDAGCTLPCPICGIRTGVNYGSSCTVCDNQQKAENREMKELEKLQKQKKWQKANKTTAEEEGPWRSVRKQRYTDEQKNLKASEQTYTQLENQQRQIDKAGAMAKMLIVRRPVGIRKRTGRVGERGLGRLARRQQHVNRRRAPGGFVEGEVAAADRMEQDGEWEDVEAPTRRNTTATSGPSGTTGGDAEQQRRTDEIGALQRSIRESYLKLTS